MDADPVAIDENLGRAERRVAMTTASVRSQHTCENANTIKGLPTIYFGRRREVVLLLSTGHIPCKACTQTDRQTDRQKDGQTDKQTDRQTDTHIVITLVQ